MLAPTRPRPISGTVHGVAFQPGRTVLRLLPLGVAALLVVDFALGDAAEYFNAVHLVHAWTEVLTGGSIAGTSAFIIGQAQLGDPLALSLGTILLIVEPAVVLAIIVVPASFVARRLVR